MRFATLYYFLWVAQNFDFPTAGFLHLVPFVVFAAHIAFFAFAMSPPFVLKDYLQYITNSFDINATMQKKSLLF